MKKKVSTEKSKKWIDFCIGVVAFWVWWILLYKINVFAAYMAFMPTYLALLGLLWLISLLRKNNGTLCGFLLSTVGILLGNGYGGDGSLWGWILLIMTGLACIYEMVGGWRRNLIGNKKSGTLDKSAKEDNWARRLVWLGLAFLLLVTGLRESDFIVSKLYFIPWPIYSDYVYPDGVEKVDFKSLDGTHLNGWYFHGKSTMASQRPVILYVHGNAGNMAAQWFQFNFLMDWGYDVFTFDYRGFGFSEGHPSREGLWMDTQAAFQELTLLQPGRKYVAMGFSMGSPYAMQLAAHEPRVSKAVFLTCFSSFREIGAYTLGAWGLPHWAAPELAWLLIPNGLDARDAERSPELAKFLIQTPSTNSGYYEDPTHVETMPPALFVQGTSDGNIPFEMTEKIASNYAGPQTFFPMPNYPHGDYFKEPLGGKFHEALDRLLTGIEIKK